MGDEAALSFNLTTNDGVVISRNSQKVSMLSIDAIKSRHRGNYTCFASNKGGVAQHSSYLAITGLKYFKLKFLSFKFQFFNHLNFAIC